MSVVNILLLALIRGTYCLKAPWPPKPCDPLVPEYCSYPFPNDYWLIKDDNLNPVHLNLSVINFPTDIHGVTIDPTAWNVLDGFNPLPSILTYFDNLSLENTNVARLWNISQSNDEDSPIIIIHAKTGERISHWVELDHNSDDVIKTEYQRTLMIWPATRLMDSERYIVAMRNLKDDNNELIAAGSAFTALRDNISTNNSAIEERRNYYNQYIFPVLQNNNINIDNTLTISWDFTVMSSKMMTNRMMFMREDAFSRINYTDGGIKYSATQIINHPVGNIARSVYGNISVPWYLNQRGPGQTVRIVTEQNDPLQPVFKEYQNVYFEMLIPRSVADRKKPATVMQFGHGLFGTIAEINGAGDMWNEWGFIVGGVNWLGLSAEDAAPVAAMISSNLTNVEMIPDRLHQGMLNALLYELLFHSTDWINNQDIFEFNGVNILTGHEQVYYWGISLGGILGSVYMSLSKHVTRGTCNVPGFPFELLLPRSKDFANLQLTLEQRYNDSSMDIDLFYSGAQMLWNRLSPSGYVGHLIPNDGYLGVPDKYVLLQYSLGDHQVSWLGGQQLGRTINAKMYRSNVAEYNETLYSLNWINDDVTINVSTVKGGVAMISGWDYKQPQVPFVNIPPNQGKDTHDFTSEQNDAQQASFRLYTEGIIYNMCNGSCQGKVPLKSSFNISKHHILRINA
eukprot:110720_1